MGYYKALKEVLQERIESWKKTAARYERLKTQSRRPRKAVRS
jgi:hypothetical protein